MFMTGMACRDFHEFVGKAEKLHLVLWKHSQQSTALEVALAAIHSDVFYG